MNDNNKLVTTIVEGIQEKKGTNITIIDLTNVDGAICNYFIICQGNSPMQTEAIMDSAIEFARTKAGEKPLKTIGEGNSEWIAVDFYDVMLHIFLPETREYYDIEGLWNDAKQTQIPDIL